MPERLPILPVNFLGIIKGPQLVSDVNTIYEVVVGVDKLWDPEVFSNLVTENEPGRPRVVAGRRLLTSSDSFPVTTIVINRTTF